MLRLTSERNGVGLCSLDFDLQAALSDSVIAFIGGRHKIKLVCIGYETFT